MDNVSIHAMDADMAGEALVNAARLGNIDNVQALIDAGADVNVQSNNGYTALIWAVRKNSLPIAQALLAAGANINLQDYVGCTALIWAVRYNSLPIVQALLAAGADVNVEDSSGHSSLWWAVRKNNIDMIRLIINADSFDTDQLVPSINYVKDQGDITDVQRQILDMLEERQTYNPMGLK